MDDGKKKIIENKFSLYQKLCYLSITNTNGKNMKTQIELTGTQAELESKLALLFLTNKKLWIGISFVNNSICLFTGRSSKWDHQTKNFDTKQEYLKVAGVFGGQPVKSVEECITYLERIFTPESVNSWYSRTYDYLPTTEERLLVEKKWNDHLEKSKNVVYRPYLKTC